MTSDLETERALSWHFINLSLTYLLRHLPTYSQGIHTGHVNVQPCILTSLHQYDFVAYPCTCDSQLRLQMKLHQVTQKLVLAVTVTLSLLDFWARFIRAKSNYERRYISGMKLNSSSAVEHGNNLQQRHTRRLWHVSIIIITAGNNGSHSSIRHAD